ncbi:MAG TPA: M28 family peptidase [Bacteroidia bacterium]
MKSLIKKYLIVSISSLALIACGPSETDTTSTTGSTTKTIETKPRVVPPDFNADSAYAYVKIQSDMGPRVPGSKAHTNCVNWMSSTLKSYGAEVIVQNGVATTFDQKKWSVKNVIASFNPENKSRILLCAHFDSRPFCDHDTIAANKNKPCPGVNDGASGVGVLMEIARNIKASNPKIGIDIIMFDLEDYGQPENSGFPLMNDSWCLGSQYWAQNPHKPGYFANFGILLDMVGGKGATFYKEGTSIFYASGVVDKVWNTASNLGYGNYLIPEPYGEFTDDHLYINKLTNIPTVDIIAYDKENGGFFSHHHKAGDTMDNIDKNTLKAVGQTVMEVIYNAE